MLQDNVANRIFIRSAIFGLRSVAPLSLAYCTYRFIFKKPSISRVLDCYAASESLFYLLIYLPRQWFLNRAAPKYSPLSSAQERKDFFEKTWNSTSDPHAYLSGWFKGVDVHDLKCEDVKDWIHWRLWNSAQRIPAHEDELEGHLEYLQQVLQFDFPPGRGVHGSMMVTVEPLHMSHRPLLWYLVSFQMDRFAYLLLMMIPGLRFWCRYSVQHQYASSWLSIPLSWSQRNVSIIPFSAMEPFV
jgi:hypothetical protein